MCGGKNKEWCLIVSCDMASAGLEGCEGLQRLAPGAERDAAHSECGVRGQAEVAWAGAGVSLGTGRGGLGGSRGVPAGTRLLFISVQAFCVRLCLHLRC